MLKLKYLFENYKLAKEALQNWKHDRDTLDEMLAQYRISSNAIYPYFHDGKVCLLRIAPVEEKLEKNILGEMEFIHYLLANDFPALEPIPATNGNECLKLNTEWGEYYVTAFKRVKGNPLEDVELSNEIMYEYGKTLGKLHTLSAQFEPVIKKWTHYEVLEWIETVLSEHHAPEDMISAFAALKKDLGSLAQNRDNYGLVHYDFELDNVFYEEESKTCSVIDFDDGMYHWYALDMEQVFGSLADELSGEALQITKSEFTRGYETEHCYTEEMKISGLLMQRFIHFYGYARLIRSVAEKLDGEPEWMIDLRKKLDQSIMYKKTNILKP